MKNADLFNLIQNSDSTIFDSFKVSLSYSSLRSLSCTNHFFKTHLDDQKSLYLKKNIKEGNCLTTVLKNINIPYSNFSHHLNVDTGTLIIAEPKSLSSWNLLTGKNNWTVNCEGCHARPHLFVQEDKVICHSWGGSIYHIIDYHNGNILNANEFEFFDSNKMVRITDNYLFGIISGSLYIHNLDTGHLINQIKDFHPDTREFFIINDKNYLVSRRSTLKSNSIALHRFDADGNFELLHFKEFGRTSFTIRLFDDKLVLLMSTQNTISSPDIYILDVNNLNELYSFSNEDIRKTTDAEKVFSQRRRKYPTDDAVLIKNILYVIDATGFLIKVDFDNQSHEVLLFIDELRNTSDSYKLTYSDGLLLISTEYKIRLFDTTSKLKLMKESMFKGFCSYKNGKLYYLDFGSPVTCYSNPNLIVRDYNVDHKGEKFSQYSQHEKNQESEANEENQLRL